ncbi:hypothetical protein Droror1_Dr00008662 [Drosera rotundifolia]
MFTSIGEQLDASSRLYLKKLLDSDAERIFESLSKMVDAKPSAFNWPCLSEQENLSQNPRFPSAPGCSRKIHCLPDCGFARFIFARLWTACLLGRLLARLCTDSVGCLLVVAVPGKRKFHKRMDRERMYRFLAGLNAEYDGLRSQLLSRSPPPSLNEACVAVQHEELRRKTMLRPIRVENAARSETLPSGRPPRRTIKNLSNVVERGRVGKSQSLRLKKKVKNINHNRIKINYNFTFREEEKVRLMFGILIPGHFLPPIVLLPSYPIMPEVLIPIHHLLSTAPLPSLLIMSE